MFKLLGAIYVVVPTYLVVVSYFRWRMAVREAVRRMEDGVTPEGVYIFSERERLLMMRAFVWNRMAAFWALTAFLTVMIFGTYTVAVTVDNEWRAMLGAGGQSGKWLPAVISGAGFMIGGAGGLYIQRWLEKRYVFERAGQKEAVAAGDNPRDPVTQVTASPNVRRIYSTESQ